MSEAAPTGSFQPVSEVKMMRLGRIIQDLRTKVPLSAEAPGEQTVIPKTEDVSHPLEKVETMTDQMSSLVCRLHQ
jgi:hypothetical protein